MNLYILVFLNIVIRRWMADIKISERKQKCIGVFETEKEAGLAYNKYAIKYHGEFARLNKI